MSELHPHNHNHNHTHTHAPGDKFDTGKVQVRLLPPRALMKIGEVLTFGAQKYAPDNWQWVPDAQERYTDALLRHIYAWQDGETNDPESGLHHLAHAGCCVLFLLWFEFRTRDELDIYAKHVARQKEPSNG